MTTPGKTGGPDGRNQQTERPPSQPSMAVPSSHRAMKSISMPGKKGINSNCSYYGDIHPEQGRGTNIRLIPQTLRMRPPLSGSQKNQAHHKSRAHDLLMDWTRSLAV